MQLLVSCFNEEIMTSLDITQVLDLDFPGNDKYLYSTTDKLLTQTYHFYVQSLFCDLKLIVDDFNCINCHALVLASAIPKLSPILKLALETSSDTDHQARLYFPDFDYQDLKKFIDSIYIGLSSKGSHRTLLPNALAQALGLASETTVEAALTKAEASAISGPLVEIKCQEETSDDDNYVPILSEFEGPLVKKKSKIDHSLSEITHFSSISMERYVEEQMTSVHQLLPYNWSLSEPSLFSCANEYQKLLESFCDAGTVIHAQTGPHFHFTQETVEEKPDSDDYYYSNTKIKRLIKMPASEILALVKVGIRQNCGGTVSNIVQPIAVKSWPKKSIFENLLESLLNIAGISKLSFYSSNRYYKFKKVTSKPNRVGRALQGLKKLSQIELDALEIKTCQEMKHFEEIHQRIPFTHLPQITTKMQFSHVSDMSVTEVQDIAVLYGDSVQDLKIKSLSHLQVRDYHGEDWIAIFLDLMVDFMGLENPLALRCQKDIYEPYDQLIFRHQAFELMKNPLKKYCIPCRIVFPYGTDQEKLDYDLHAQEHCVKKEESTGVELARFLTCTGSTKCSKLFQTQEALEEHVAKSHDKSVKGDGSYCDTCGKFLPNVHRLKKHNDAHHRQIKCKICNQVFAGTIGLASHRDKLHSQQLPCPHCHKLLPSKVKLEYHMISHKTPEEKKYICEKCGKRFGWSHHLAKHEMNVHVRSRPYKCSVQGCNWAFNDLSNRNMHERRVHKLGPPPKR